jgi:hypothetical protein
MISFATSFLLLLIVATTSTHSFQSVSRQQTCMGGTRGVTFPHFTECNRFRSVVALAANEQPIDEESDSSFDDEIKNRFLIKEIEGEDNTKTGQFIVSKKNSNGDVPLFAFSAPPAPLSDSLIVVGATVGGLFGLVIVFLFSNKDIIPFTGH